MRNLFRILLILQYFKLSISFSVLVCYKKHARVTATLLRASAPEKPHQYETAEERFNARWNAMFERLKQYKEEYGDCLVPSIYEDDPQLGCWVNNQRQAAPIDEKIAQQRRDKLNSIGFVWSIRKQGRSKKLDEKWNDKFERLKEYRQNHGDCHVPTSWPQDPQLARWVKSQRCLFANNKLRSDRKAQLESIGFAWKVGNSLTENEEQWETMFAKLSQYRDKHGDCLVPASYEEDPQLGDWVRSHRARQSDLDPTRKEKLESIGFAWSALDQQWETMFAKLEEYRDKHGDCLVPQRYKDDTQLGRWVQAQRLKRPELNPARKEKLESIGFRWRVKGIKSSAV